MKRFIIYMCLLGCMVSAVSCSEKIHGISLEADKFVACRQPGMVRWAGYVFLYEPETCQQVVNTVRKTLRYQTDDQAGYVHMEFAVWPFSADVAEMNVIDVKLTCRIAEKTSSMEIPMIILKREDTRIWLWNDEQKAGIIVEL